MSVDTVRDLTGQAVSHRTHESVVVQRERLWWVAPTRRPFYTSDLVVHDPLREVDLIAGDDYVVIHLDDEWSSRTQQELGHFLVITDARVGSVVEITSQVLGGPVLDDAPTISDVRDFVESSDLPPRWGAFITRETADPDIEEILALTRRVTFQHVVEETEAVRQAILYGDVEDHQDMMVYAADTRQRYYQRILQLMQVARDAIAAHAANKYAHSVTPTQVGLGQYPNYPVAARIVLEAGVSYSHLVTPKGFSLMLSRFADGPLQDHYVDTPAHSLTPAQVGLGYLENYPLAPPTVAELGKSKEHYMTPGVTLGALQYQFSSQLYQHRVDQDAHAVTPFQVGLGQYADYPLYSIDDFDNVDTVDDQYLTPKGVYSLIRHHFWNSQLSHVYDTDNPHNLTPAQVGLGDVDNLSRDAYDALYVDAGHHHTARSLPFSDEDLKNWQDTAGWVLESRVTDHRPGVIWDASDRTGATIHTFPDTESTKVTQVNTVITATNRQSGETEEREGTVSLEVEQIEPVADAGVETATIPWPTRIQGDNAVTVKVIPDIPEEAWPLTSATLTSTDSALSTASIVDILPYVSRNEIAPGVYEMSVDEVAVRDALFSDVDTATPVPVTLFLSYERPVGGVMRYRYQVNNEIFWLEAKRLFPELTHEDHSVSADLFFLMELPDRLKGPDGIFFRPTGHYPYLRAQATTKGDVGLPSLPNWSEQDFMSRYALANHDHPGEGWIERSVMDSTYLKKSDGDALASQIRSQVWFYIKGSPVKNHALRHISGGSFFRAAPYENPGNNAIGQLEYRRTNWSLSRSDGGIGTTSWTITTNDHQTPYLPIVANNTGTWYVSAIHTLWDDDASHPNRTYSTQPATTVVETGDPVNPPEWAYSIYANMLARGGDPYLRNNGGGAPTWADAGGPGYWMNVKKYSTRTDMQKDIAFQTINTAHSGGSAGAASPNGDTRPYYNSISFLNLNFPGWNWNTWSRIDYSSPTADELAAQITVTALNNGNWDVTNQVQYRSASYHVVDPSADPVMYQIKTDRRTSKFNLF